MLTETTINEGSFFRIRTRNFSDGTNCVFLDWLGAPKLSLTKTEFEELALLMNTTEYPGKD